MTKPLEEFWYGNVCPYTDCRFETSEKNDLIGHITNHRNNLMTTLTDRQKEILEKLDDCYLELADINEREIFVYAFRLGAKFAVESMFECGSIE